MLLQHAQMQLELLLLAKKKIGVGPQAGLGCEALAAQVAVERAAFGALDLRIVVAQVLLQIRQLDKRAAAVRQMALNVLLIVMLQWAITGYKCAIVAQVLVGRIVLQVL
uniref:Uncharacterized protein n=1 Tax=Anopheles farauti TaxID=69004 RepID=A0A182QDX1_9DIPT